MYAFLTGVVEEKTDNTVVVNVNGVGYEVYVSTFTSNSLPIGEIATIYTYLHVREDAFLLFGFSSKQEKNVFLELITVSGIGAKTAIQILSGATLDELIMSIVNGDVRVISGIKGIGKKTAERIVLELRGKFENVSLNDTSILADAIKQQNSETDEAVMLLVNMGLSRNEAMNLVKQVATPDDTIEQIITKALKNMG